MIRFTNYKTRYPSPTVARLYKGTPEPHLIRMNAFLLSIFEQDSEFINLILLDIVDYGTESSVLLLRKVQFLVDHGANIYYRREWQYGSTFDNGSRIPLIAEYFNELRMSANKIRDLKIEAKLNAL